MDQAVGGASPGTYPEDWAADVVLRDGSIAHVRPVRPEDRDQVRAFFGSMSKESRALRFFTTADEGVAERDLLRLTQVNHRDDVTLLATLRDEIVGVAEYARSGPTDAEVAFTVADTQHGRGVGSILLEHLGAAARERGFQRFVAKVLPSNKKMLGVFRDAGYEVVRGYEFGVVALEFHIDPTDRSRAVMEAREHGSEAASLRPLLMPTSVAVVGASRDPSSIGAAMLRHLLSAGFAGTVYAVNPRADEVQCMKAFASVSDLPEAVDLAVLAVPASLVSSVVEECGRTGVRGLIVTAGGFAETGEEGMERQREIVRLSRSHGMRLIGPMSIGLVNTDPEVMLNASLAERPPPAGGLGLFSQSGALGLAILASARRRNLGLSCFVSAGNRADVSGNDCMQYLEQDPRTQVVGLYLESIGNPRKFSRIARRLSRSKPVVVVKSGMSGHGVPPGHVVRASGLSQEGLTALMHQAGVLRVDNMHQLFDVAQLLMHQPRPTGPRIGIAGNSVAMATLIADAAASSGLVVGAEPVSVPPTATPEDFRKALKAAYADPGTDAVVACFIPPVGSLDEGVLQAVAEESADSLKPTVACLFGLRGVAALPPVDEAAEGLRRGIPTYPTPEDAVLALATAVRYAQWLERDPGVRVDPPGIDRYRARQLVDRLLADADGRDVEVRRGDLRNLLGCYGITLADEHLVSTLDEAVAAGESLGWPVLLMTEDAEGRRSRRVRGVVPDIADAGELCAEVLALQRRAPGTTTFVVQHASPSGIRCVLRTVEDPLFGPVVSFGLAGVTSELLGDVAHRVPPLTVTDVEDLIGSVRAARTLTGYLDSSPLDVPALQDVVSRLSCLADDLPQVFELEINPLVVAEAGVVNVAAYARLAEPKFVRTDAPHRRLMV